MDEHKKEIIIKNRIENTIFRLYETNRTAQESGNPFKRYYDICTIFDFNPKDVPWMFIVNDIISLEYMCKEDRKLSNEEQNTIYSNIGYNLMIIAAMNLEIHLDRDKINKILEHIESFKNKPLHDVATEKTFAEIKERAKRHKEPLIQVAWFDIVEKLHWIKNKMESNVPIHILDLYTRFIELEILTKNSNSNETKLLGKYKCAHCGRHFATSDADMNKDFCSKACEWGY